MKNLARIILGSALLVFTSCSDFLEKGPHDSPNSSVPVTDAVAVALTNGCYQSLQSMNLYNQRIWTLDICAGNSEAGGDPSTGTDGQETKEVANFYATPNNDLALGMWRGGWVGIGNCNTTLANIEASESVSEEIKKRSLGEAHFLRAHYYFILVRAFGGVPVITQPHKASDPVDIARNSTVEVYDLIIRDCKDAISMLPEKRQLPESELGRATKDAALMQLAKVYLTMAGYDATYKALEPENGFYDEVVNLCTQIEGLGYDLSQCKYEDLCGVALCDKKNGPESIFEIQYSGENSGTGGFWNTDGQSSWCSIFMGPRSSGFVTGGGWGWNQPTDEFFNSYEEGDLRKDLTVLYEGCPAFDGKEYKASYAFVTGRNVRKFLVPDSYGLASSEVSPQNFIAYRFADVLLMKAEALNELGETTLAQQPLNIVRKRAGLPDCKTSNQEEMREKIIHERRMELAFEGHRWFDLIRLQGGDYALKFFHSIGKTNATKDRLLLPIPQKEMDSNKLMVQNPGY